MTMIDLQELGDRVRRMPIERPDPANVTARLLKLRASVRPRWSWSVPRPIRPLAAVVGVLLLAWEVLYIARVTGAALAGSPVGPFSSFVLQEVRIPRQSDQSFRSNPINHFGAIRSTVEESPEGSGVR